ncbi:MAG: triose-phosphate isomerase [Betaproteobacteria bacterium]|nr:triose-phosphate isomerase [Betaproteobacteria bacterium]
MRSKFVAGNWKMNGSLAANEALLSALAAAPGIPRGGVAVLAPFPYLGQCADLLRGSTVSWGAQDVSVHESGAYTGEVSGSMLLEFGCRFVVVGHSERRAMHGETSELVARKAVAAVKAGLTPIVCVGETLQERESGRTQSVIGEQLDAVLSTAGMEVVGKSILAYEPVWAIGTGKTATPAQAQEVHSFIRRRVAGKDAGCAEGVLILYGGSVKGSNAGALFSEPDVDGGLVGGASLVAADFLEICKAAFVPSA